MRKSTPECAKEIRLTDNFQRISRRKKGDEKVSTQLVKEIVWSVHGEIIGRQGGGRLSFIFEED